jgi:FKBP-type peptidyl-prolyl cis-trans isomerase SlpA
MAQIGPGSHVTLHYRLAVIADDKEREIVSTLALKPATLQLGAGQLAPALEERLLGLAEGERRSFDLAADEAYGRRHPDLVQTLSRAAFDENADSESEYVPGDLVELRAAEGGRISGVLKSLGDTQVVVDFNHPLAGVPLRFSVQVIGVL